MVRLRAVSKFKITEEFVIMIVAMNDCSWTSQGAKKSAM